MVHLHWALQFLIAFFVMGWLLAGCMVLVDGLRLSLIHI